MPETYTNTSPDPLKEVAAEAIGKDGMKIDREMYRQRFASQAQEAAAAHPDLREAVASENWPAAESIVARLLMNKPTEFWNLLKLQEIFRSDRTPSLREILQVIFGLLPGVATREQVAGEHFERYLATQPVDATKLRESRQVFLAYVLDGMARSLIEAGDFAGIRARDAALYQSLKALGADGIAPLRTYIAANVPEADLSAVA